MTSTCSEMYNNHKTEPLCEYLFRHCLFCICGRAWLFWTISLQRQNNCLVSIKDNHGKGWTMNPPQMGMQGNWCRKRVFFQHFFNSQFCKDQCFNVLWDTILHFLLSFLWIGKTCCSYQNGDVVTFERKHRYRRMSGIFFLNMVIESGRGFYFSLSF